MKNIFTKIPKKLYAVVAGVVTAGAISIGVGAYGPERPTFTIQNPAQYVTFNSITNNPYEGDERNFLRAKDAANPAPSAFGDNVAVKDGQEVLVRVYVHNNAATRLNSAENNYRGIARDTKVRVHVPTATAKALRANAYVSASNADPAVVYDYFDLSGDTPFSLEYVPGSAIAYNNAHPGTTVKVSDSIVTTGAPVGYNQMDGNLPGCLEFANVITIKLKVKMSKPGYMIDKKVAIPGQAWTQSVTAKPGDSVNYSIEFKNTGNTPIENVVVRDQLPKDMTIVPGSTKIYNVNNPNGLIDNSDAVVKPNGIAIGSYTAGSNAYVTFKAKVPAEDKLACGMNKLVNIGEVSQSGQFPVTDTADVTVEKKCEPTVVTKKCDGLDATKVSATQYNFKARASVQNAVIQNYVFTAKDKDGKVVDTKTVTTNATSADYVFTQAIAGTYTVTAVVNTDKGVAEGDCSKQVTIEDQKVVLKECKSLDVKKVTRTKFEFTAKASVQNAVIQNYVFTAKDKDGKVVDTKTVTTNATEAVYTFENATSGTYSVSVVINTDQGATTVGNCIKQVTVEEEPKNPIYECKDLKISTPKDRKVTATVTPHADDGAVLKSISYDFGDGTKVATDKTVVEHTFAKDGDYTIKAVLTFTVNGQDQTSSAPICVANVTIKTPVTPVVQGAAQTLPNTGAGSVIGIFAGASTLAGAAHYLFSRRRG